jgi:hypothetical protein
MSIFERRQLYDVTLTVALTSGQSLRQIEAEDALYEASGAFCRELARHLGGEVPHGEYRFSRNTEDMAYDGPDAAP